jgi:hypothetical protein
LGVFSAVRAIGPFIAKKGLLYHSFFWCPVSNVELSATQAGRTRTALKTPTVQDHAMI